MEKTKPPGNARHLLEVGCHIGVFVEIAARHGWNARGVEPSRWAAHQAQASGLQVVEGALLRVGFHKTSVEVVTMWDVIEYVEQPLAEMGQAYRLLKPGGLFVAHTIDLDGLFARLGVGESAIPVNLGDLVTVCAAKPQKSPNAPHT